MLIGAFCFSLWGAYPAIAQPNDREWQRVEDQVNRLADDASRDAVNLEKRLSAIEYNQRQIADQVAIVTKLGLAIMASVTGLIIQSLWGLIVRRQKASD